MSNSKNPVIIVKRKDAKPIDPNAKKALRVANLPWEKIKHLVSKKPPQRPLR